MKTKLLGRRKPTQAEKEKGAEIVFERECKTTGRVYTILGCKCYESWEQWGAPAEILSDNVNAIENWRRGYSIHQSL